MNDSLRLVSDALLFTDRDLLSGGLIDDPENPKARMLSAGLTRALVSLFFGTDRTSTPTLDELARFGFDEKMPQARHDLRDLVRFCEQEPCFEFGAAQRLSSILGPETVDYDRIQFGDRTTWRPAGQQQQRLVDGATFTLVVTDTDMSGRLVPDPALRAAPRNPSEHPDLDVTITDGCGVCGVCGTCGLCVVCGELNAGVVGASSAALWSIGGSATMQYSDPALADSAARDQIELLSLRA